MDAGDGKNPGIIEITTLTRLFLRFPSTTMQCDASRMDIQIVKAYSLRTAIVEAHGRDYGGSMPGAWRGWRAAFGLR